MEKLKKQLREEAEKEHGKIYPAGRYRELEDCYTVHGNHLLFWYNLEDQTTKTKVREITPNAS